MGDNAGEIISERPSREGWTHLPELNKFRPSINSEKSKPEGSSFHTGGETKSARDK